MSEKEYTITIIIFSVFICMAVMGLFWVSQFPIFQPSSSIRLPKSIMQKKTKTQAQKVNQQNCIADDCLAVMDLNYPTGDLPSDVRNALEKALQDEYKAYAFYEKVINQFGNERPFVMIIRAEEQHASQLKALYDKYGLVPPQNEWAKTIEAPVTLQSACQAGVEAEIANTKLYKETLLPIVKEYEDITQVFTYLMKASEQKHLPAFQRCSQ